VGAGIGTLRDFTDQDNGFVQPAEGRASGLIAGKGHSFFIGSLTILTLNGFTIKEVPIAFPPDRRELQAAVPGYGAVGGVYGGEGVRDTGPEGVVCDRGE
jgi:hypothetical protein